MFWQLGQAIRSPRNRSGARNRWPHSQITSIGIAIPPLTDKSRRIVPYILRRRGRGFQPVRIGMVSHKLSTLTRKTQAASSQPKSQPVRSRSRFANFCILPIASRSLKLLPLGFPQPLCVLPRRERRAEGIAQRRPDRYRPDDEFGEINFDSPAALGDTPVRFHCDSSISSFLTTKGLR